MICEGNFWKDFYVFSNKNFFNRMFNRIFQWILCISIDLWKGLFGKFVVLKLQFFHRFLWVFWVFLGFWIFEFSKVFRAEGNYNTKDYFYWIVHGWIFKDFFVQKEIVTQRIFTNRSLKLDTRFDMTLILILILISIWLILFCLVFVLILNLDWFLNFQRLSLNVFKEFSIRI